MIDRCFKKLILTLFFVCAAVFVVTAQTTTQISSDDARALELIKQNRFLDALPLLEKIAKTNPASGDFWANYAMAIYSRSQTLATAAERKTERLVARAVAQKAKELGSQHPFMRDLLANIPPDGGTGDFVGNPAVNAALLEGEALFGRGEFEKAFLAYERAAKLDPKNYEAVVFAGDTFFARKMYAESETWFARAVAINPNRETAHRFWADALMVQNKPREARDKYVEALIAEPFNKQSWDNLTHWAERSGGWNPTGIKPPGGEFFGAITFDETLLKPEDGTANWRRYGQMRDLWQKQIFKKEFPNEKQYRRTLREEASAMRLVAETTKSDVSAGRIKNLDKSLANLIKISDAGLLEAYILFPRMNDEIAEDYEDYRRLNRDKLHRFIVEFLIGGQH